MSKEDKGITRRQWLQASSGLALAGDTTPCDSLIQLAQGADVLVHEVIHKPSLARLLARVPNADRLVEHIVACHTTHVDVGGWPKRPR